MVYKPPPTVPNLFAESPSGMTHRVREDKRTKCSAYIDLAGDWRVFEVDGIPETPIKCERCFE